jgi:importin subunit alpha-1
MSGE